jgi:hypothetical protein
VARSKILSAAAILSMMIATPAFAQAAIQEPGAFAFYHPNVDGSSCAQRYRSYNPGSGTFLGYDRRRHPCE